MSDTLPERTDQATTPLLGYKLTIRDSQMRDGKWVRHIYVTDNHGAVVTTWTQVL